MTDVLAIYCYLAADAVAPLAIKIGLVSPFLGPFGSGRGFQSLLPHKYWVFEGIWILAKDALKDKGAATYGVAAT